MTTFPMGCVVDVEGRVLGTPLELISLRTCQKLRTVDYSNLATCCWYIVSAGMSLKDRNDKIWTSPTSPSQVYEPANNKMVFELHIIFNLVIHSTNILKLKKKISHIFWLTWINGKTSLFHTIHQLFLERLYI